MKEWSDIQAAREQAAHNRMQRNRKWETALKMREEGCTTEEIRERTGMSKRTQEKVFRGMGRRR